MPPSFFASPTRLVSQSSQHRPPPSPPPSHPPSSSPSPAASSQVRRKGENTHESVIYDVSIKERRAVQVEGGLKPEVDLQLISATTRNKRIMSFSSLLLLQFPERVGEGEREEPQHWRKWRRREGGSGGPEPLTLCRLVPTVAAEASSPN